MKTAISYLLTALMLISISGCTQANNTNNALYTPQAPMTDEEKAQATKAQMITRAQDILNTLDNIEDSEITLIDELDGELQVDISVTPIPDTELTADEIAQIANLISNMFDVDSDRINIGEK